MILYFEYFIYYLMAPIVLVLGLCGNITALVVFFKGNLKKIGPILIYQLMFICDTYYITQILVFYLQYSFNLNLSTLSRFACKLVSYLNYQMDAVSSYLLVYISLEKYISISNPAKRSILISKKSQIIFFICIFIFCSIYNIPISFLVDIFEFNQTYANGTNISYLNCYPISYEAQMIASYIDIINREILPGILMICFSFMLVLAVFRSSSRVANSITSHNRHKKDVRLAINCFFMYFVFILLQTPSSVAFFLPDLFSETIIYSSTSYLFFLSYGINFYIILACNSLFREEFYKILRKIIC